MRGKIARTALSLAVAVAAVMAVRWTIRAAMTRAYRAERDVGSVEMPVVPAPRAHSLAEMVPEELHVNIAGLSVRRRAERLGIPYSLAADVAEEKAVSAGWERLDDENALTIGNLSGMERVYKTPEGSIALRELRPIAGNDTLLEDFVIPAELVPTAGVAVTPDDLARRSAARVKELMPPVLRNVVVGSPMLVHLIERGEGAALIVHCVADVSALEARRKVSSAAREAGWRESLFGAIPGEGEKSSPRGAASWTKDNLTLYYEAVQRDGGGCDVNYRFTDDEVYIQRKGNQDED